MAALTDALERGDLSEVDRILSAMGSAVTSEDVAALLRSLRDVEEDAAVFAVVHTAEAAPVDAYVRGALDAVVSLASLAPDAAGFVVTRILNSEDALGLLISAIAGRADDPAVKVIVAIASGAARRNPARFSVAAQAIEQAVFIGG